MITVPMLLFNPEDNDFTIFMAWLAMIFWTLDIGMSVNTGITVEDGKVNNDRKAILKAYLKTWFILDCIVVVPDWTMTFLELLANQDNGSAAGMTRTLKGFRAIRGLRLLRLAKLKKAMDGFYDTLNSDITFLVVQLVQLIIVLVFLNHWVACFWYGIGSLSRTVGEKLNWLENVGITPVWEEGLGWKYLTSLHWSITQFTPASMDISATNNIERVFSIVVLFMSLVSCSSLIGFVSATMAQIRSLTGEKTNQFWQLRRFLELNKVEWNLRERILRYAENKFDQKHKEIPMSRVPLLLTLSDGLKAEVLASLFARTMHPHPFFSYLDEQMPKILRQLCSTAVKPRSLASDEVVFRTNEESSCMYFLKIGQCNYTPAGQTNPRSPPFGKSEWIAEMALWSKWRFRGDFIAIEESELILLSADEFGKSMRSHPRSWHFALNYAKLVVSHVNYLDPGSVTDMTYEEDASNVVSESDVFDDYGMGKEAPTVDLSSPPGSPLTRFTLPFKEDEKQPEQPIVAI